VGITLILAECAGKRRLGSRTAVLVASKLRVGRSTLEPNDAEGESEGVADVASVAMDGARYELKVKDAPVEIEGGAE
jgi:hypothetical protein